MIDFSEISNILKLPPKIMSGLVIASGLLLFLPQKSIEKLYMVGFKSKYGFVIGVIFIVSVSILVCYIVGYMFNWISEKYYRKKLIIARKELIRHLDPMEKEILKKMMSTYDRTLVLPVNNGVVIQLAFYEAISPAGTTHSVDVNDMRIPYFIQPWAYEELKKKPELLN